MKSIIVDGSICRCFQKIGTSIYDLSCIIYFNIFLKVGVCFIIYMCFQEIEVYNNGCCYCERKTKEKLVLCENQ
jgi:hypothetical protein